MTLTQREALDELVTYDHAFLTQEGAERLAEPFGFKPRCYKHEDTSRTDPKGLSLNGGAKSAIGIGAHILAEQIAESVGAQWDRPMGRGSALRQAVAAARAKLNDGTEQG